MSVGVDVRACRCTGILLGVGCDEHVDGCVSVYRCGCV